MLLSCEVAQMDVTPAQLYAILGSMIILERYDHLRLILDHFALFSVKDFDLPIEDSCQDHIPFADLLRFYSSAKLSSDFRVINSKTYLLDSISSLLPIYRFLTIHR